MVVAFDAVANFDLVLFRRVYMDKANAKANARSRSDLHETFLHLAIRHMENSQDYSPLLLFDYLLSKGADLNATNASGDTLLHYAVAQACPLVVKWLLVHGADVWIRNSSGELAVDLSVKMASRVSGIDDVRQVVTQLLQDWMPEDKGMMAKLTHAWKNELYTLRATAVARLYKAAENALREYDSFRLAEAIDSGAPINEPIDESGVTLLMIAAQVGSLRYVSFLAERGGDVTHLDASSASVLHHAIHLHSTDEHADVIRFLVQEGAPLNHADCPGEDGSGTPIQKAAALPQSRPIARIISVLREAESERAAAAAAAAAASAASGNGAPGSSSRGRRKGRLRRKSRKSVKKGGTRRKRRSRSDRKVAKLLRADKRRRKREAAVRAAREAHFDPPKPKSALDQMELAMEVDAVKAKYKVGDRIVYRGQKGTVAFVGLTLFASGVWVGLALDEPKGRHSGVLNSKRYFVANPNCGVFARPDSVVHL